MTDNVVTKVKDLIVLLQQCDPEGEIKINLDAALVDGDGDLDGVEYNFDPVVACYFTSNSKQADALSDSIYIGIGEEKTEELLADRVRARENGKGAIAPSNSSIAENPPVAIAIAISNQTYQNLVQVVDACNRSHKATNGANTHGPLDISGLLSMLAEDAAMTNSRPGSWEGANMQNVLDSHGYQ